MIDKNNMIEKVNLKNYKRFVDIDKTYYGGKQEWLNKEGYLTKFKADRSCGLIAAANTIIYMSRNHLKLEKDYKSKEKYIGFVYYLYNYIKPRIYGIPTVSIMVRGLNKYAESMNFDIVPFLLINPSSKLRLVEYIKEGLKKDCPIMMLTWNSRIPNLKYHWVTITGYYLTKAEEHYIVTSNWGRKETFSLDKWFDENVFYKGLLYFKIQNKIEKNF